MTQCGAGASFNPMSLHFSVAFYAPQSQKELIHLGQDNMAVMWQITFQVIFFERKLYCQAYENHDDVIKWKHFPRNWPFVLGIHRSRWIAHTKASDAELRIFTDICS